LVTVLLLEAASCTRAIAIRTCQLRLGPRAPLLFRFASCILMITTELVWLIRLLAIGLAVPEAPAARDIRENPSDFVHSLRLSQWTERMVFASSLYCSVGGFAAVLYLTQLMAALRFHMRMRALVDTIVDAMRAMEHFLLVYGCCLLTLSISGVVLFGESVPIFSSLSGAMRAVWITSLGAVDEYVDDLYAAQPIVGPIYFVVLVLTLTFLMLNVLISLVIRSFEALGDRDSKEYSTGILTSFIYWLLCSRSELLKADGVLRAQLGRNLELVTERNNLLRLLERHHPNGLERGVRRSTMIVLRTLSLQESERWAKTHRSGNIGFRASKVNAAISDRRSDRHSHGIQSLVMPLFNDASERLRTAISPGGVRTQSGRFLLRRSTVSGTRSPRHSASESAHGSLGCLLHRAVARPKPLV